MPKKSRRTEKAEQESSTSEVQSETRPLNDDATKETEEQDSADVRGKIDKSGLYDTQQVKRLLDDEIIAFMEDAGYEESTATSNVKLLAGTIAVAAALYSHFGVREWVHSRNAVFTCVFIYIVCTLAINISSVVLEGSAMFVGYLGPAAKRVTRGKLPQNVWVHSNFVGRGSSEIKLEIRCGVRNKVGNAEHGFHYEKYVTSEGQFLREMFRKEMTKLLNKVQGEGKKKN